MSDITKFNGGKAFEAKKATDYETGPPTRNP